MNDLIAALDYNQFADYVYTGKEEIPSGVVSVSTEHIRKFFQTHGENGKNYIIISCCCDYGVFYQEENPVKNDFVKGLQLLQLGEYDGYSGVVIQPRCNLNLCHPDNKYSIKCYAFTHSTFPYIPSNIKKWFLVNSNLDEPNVVNIPLGLYHEGAKEVLQTVSDLPNKTELLYLNWTNYTQERVALKQYFQQFDWCDVDEGRRDFKEFLLNMARYKFILCPEGNGLDSHRNIESLYLECVPILLNNRFNRNLYGNTGALLVNGWQEVTKEFLQNYQDLYPKCDDSLKLSYWETQIAEAKKLLC